MRPPVGTLAARMVLGKPKVMETSFNWVAARSQCSLKRVFETLAEIVDSDVKAANELPGRKAQFHVNGGDKKLVVSRDKSVETATPVSTVVFELFPAEISVRHGRDTKLFSARPRLNDDGECMLEVDGQALRLWQVSRKALEDLFFGD